MSVNLTKAHILRLNKYLDDLLNRRQSPIPEKHSEHGQSYINYLDREIETTKSKLERLRLDAEASK